MSFVHLHVHSQYSLLEATCTAKQLAKRAAELAMPAVALTDSGNMFGAIEFFLACKDAGVKPLLGLEVLIAPKSRLSKGEDKDPAPNRRMVLLAMNANGYKNICRLSTIGYQEGFYYKPRVDYEVLEKYSDDLIALSGGVMGDVPWTLLNRGEEEALNLVKRLQGIYKDRFYLEMNRTGVRAWDQINPFLQEASRSTGVPLVAANDVHFMAPEDQVAQEVLICIGTNRTLQDETRFRLGSDQFYFRSSEEMQKLFKDIPEALQNTIEIANRCDVKFKLKDEKGNPIYHLPSYPTAEGVTTKMEMERLSRIGLEQRFHEATTRGEPIPEGKKPEYLERLLFELGVIDRMGFNGYFLIVQDFIGWAKANDIPVGPGRGSGAGSLVAYSLRITDLDPMPYNLLFERFLNPERISMPDFDIDFCQTHRGRVIDYVTKKYGQQSVSQIITYGRLQARAAIRDVGRVMGMTYPEVDAVSKLVPEKLGINLKEAVETEPRLRELMDQDPKVNSLMELAQKIEGLVRHAGIHAAGVIIADGNINDHAPLYRGVDGENVVQYDMKHAEKIGLIKFDFLGLKTLTHIQDALNLIERNRGKKFTTQSISLSDKGIYELMSAGDTAGIFQFEGDGMIDLLRKAKPTVFEDIVAINALYRPGPMEKIPEYLDGKVGGKKIRYMFPELETILKETYGVMVYQEQVQLVAAMIANYSLGEADLLRRAMGKKIISEMAQQKARFLDGAKKNNHDAEKAEELFDQMAEFANYGFNKSHAAAYCVVAAHTAWLKHYYPVEFYAALLSTEMSDTDKIVKYVKDAQAHNINVLPPHISHSEYNFYVKGDTILFSLGAIKGVGEGAVEAIVEARKGLGDSGFASLDQFFDLVDVRRVNKKTIEALIKAGAMDGFGYNRNELLLGFSKFVERAVQSRDDREVGQTSLFDVGGSGDAAMQATVQLEKKEPWSRALSLSYEKEVLGFYLTDHPLKGLDVVTKVWSTTNVASLATMNHKSKTTLVGLLATMREIITKKGTRMAFARFEDMSGHVELVIFPDVFAIAERALKSERPLLISGTLENEESAKIIVESVKVVDDLLQQVKRVTVNVHAGEDLKLDLLKQLAAKYPGEKGMYLRLHLAELKRSVEVELSDPKGINPSADFVDSVISLMGHKNSIELG